MANILQSSLMTEFMYPLLLTFFIIFGVLEKTSILGKETKQLNAGVALVIALIFTSFIFPKIAAANMVTFMAVFLVVIFIGMMMYSFLGNTSDGFLKKDGDNMKIHKVLVVVGVIIFIGGIFWSTGVGDNIWSGVVKVAGLFTNSNWAGSFWSNFMFIALIAVAVAVAVGWNPFKGDTNWWIKVK